MVPSFFFYSNHDSSLRGTEKLINFWRDVDYTLTLTILKANRDAILHTEDVEKKIEGVEDRRAVINLNLYTQLTNIKKRNKRDEKQLKKRS